MAIMQTDSSSFPEIHIRRKAGLFSFDLKELIRYRDLVVLLIYRDFSSRYKQTILGPGWFVLQPLLTTLVFTVIFGKLAALPTDGIPPVLFYLCGMLGWNYHATVLQATGNSFQSNADLFGKVYFPRIIAPFSASASQLIGWAIQFVTFLVVLGVYAFMLPEGNALLPSWRSLLLPIFVLQAGMTGLGTGLWLSALSAKYRDLQHLQSFIIQLWLYVTPIVYPLSMIPERWQWIALINPMTTVVESTRWSMLGSATFSLSTSLIGMGISTLLLISGVLLFGKVERNFVDTV